MLKNKRYLILLMLIINAAKAESMVGTVQVSLTIMPTPCQVTSTVEKINIDCGTLSKETIQKIDQLQTTTNNSDDFLVTISY